MNFEVHHHTFLILLILIIVLCEGAAQYSAKIFSQTNSLLYLLIGGLFYTMVIAILSNAHKIAPMGVANGIWSGLSIIFITLIGYAKFGQKIRGDQVAVLGVIAASVYYLTVNHDFSNGNGDGGG